MGDAPVQPAPAAQADLVIARLDRLPVNRLHVRAAATLGAGTFFDAFDTVSIGVVLTAVSATFGLDPAQAGWLVSAGFLGQAAGALGFGLVSERWGRRRVFVAALVVMGALSVLAVASWNAPSFAGARFLQGLGLGAEVPVASALLSELLPSARRGRVAVLYKLASPAGNLATSLAAAALLATTPPETAWRLLFVVGAAPLLVALAALALVPESPRYLVRRGRTDEALRVVERMEAAATGPLPAPEPSPAAPADLARTRPAELFTAGYRARTLLAWTLWASTFFTLLGATTWLPSQYVRVGHVSAATASLLAGSVTVVVIAAIVGAAALVDRVGRRVLLTVGYAVSSAGAALGAVLAVTGRLDGIVALYAAGALLLLGVSTMDPLVYAYTAELFPTRMRSWATMSSSAWRSIAAVVAPIVIGQLLGAGWGLGAVFVLFLVVLLAGLAVQLATGPETSRALLEGIAR